MFALYTLILSPTPSLSSRITLTLWTEALLTVVPSSSTGSKMAMGFIRPVLEALHSISRSVVSLSSSLHLKAMESLGNFEVAPKDLPYSISSYTKTRPSEGMGFFSILLSKDRSSSLRPEASTILYSTTWNPLFSSHSNCSCRVPKVSPSADTRLKAKNLTLLCAVI